MSMLPPPGTRVVIYARYSSNLQHFKSIEDQVSLCRDYAARHGWVVVEVYYDAERSGTTLVGREGFFLMMASADRGEFELVLAEDLDRLSRTPSDTHSIVEDLDVMDIGVCTVASGMVSDLEVAFKAAQNAQYVKQLGAKTRRGQEGTVKSGRISGSVSYGYKKVYSADGKNGLRVIDIDQAIVVVRIFKDYVAGVSTIAICRALNAEGIPGPRGKGWRPGALTGTKGADTGILRNKLYIGEFHWGRTSRKRDRRKGKFKTKATPAASRLVAKVPDLRIIDDELFQAAQERLEARSAGSFNEQRQAEYLFSRKVACGVCGEPMAIMNKRLGCTARALKGTCDNGRRVPREDLEEAVLSSFKDNLLLPDVIGESLDEYRRELALAIAEQEKRAESAQGRLKDVERQIENVMSQVREGLAPGLAGQLLMQELNRLEAERQRCVRDASAKPDRAVPNLEPKALTERLHVFVDDLRTALAGDTREATRARELIRAMIDKIVVTPIHQEKEDGRGAGPVRLTIHGGLTQMLDLAEVRVGRAVLHGSCPKSGLDSSTLGFRYWIDLPYKEPRLIGEGYEDLAVLARLLDRGDVPVTKQAILQAFAGGVPPEVPEVLQPLERRMREATERFKTQGLARAVRLGPEKSGWVWNDYRLTDEEWRERAFAELDQPLPMFRILPPEASVVVIGPGVCAG